MPKMNGTVQLSPEQRKAVVVESGQCEIITPVDRPIRRGCPKAPKRKKKRRKKKESYKDMMAAVLNSGKTTAEKIQEKREALDTPSCEPPKLVTI